MTIDGLVEKVVGALIGSVVTLGLYFNNLRITRINKQAEEAKQEREKAKKEIDELCERIEKVEEVDKTAYPAFKELQVDFKILDKLVNNQHQIALHDLKADQDKMRLANEQRFVYTENKILDLDKKLDKLTTIINDNSDKAQRNHEKVMDQLLKLTGK